MKKILYTAFCVILSCTFAILVHAILPEDTNTALMNSQLVRAIGFPMVAVFYFLVLYIHCGCTMIYFGNRSLLNTRELALRFGLGYGLIYFIGMFELVPGVKWDINVGINQFFVGAGDLIPVVLLSILLIKVLKKKGRASCNKLITMRNVPISLCVAVIFILFRIVGYLTNIIESSIKEYPVPVVLWTILFGITLGISVSLIYPVIKKDKKYFSLLLILGLNWLWFNSFMALIMDGLWLTVILRVSVDFLGICVGVFLHSKITKSCH